jgi:hypothetical protein
MKGNSMANPAALVSSVIEDTAVKVPRAGTKAAKAKEPTESFAKLTGELAKAEAEAAIASADNKEATARKSTAAVSTLKAAFREKLDNNDVRVALLDAGILKGTVSKIVTVLDALKVGFIVPGDIKSLNGAYSAVKAAEKAAAAASAAIGVTPYAKATAAAAVSPKDALKIIVDAVKSITDPDEQFKAVGDWIAQFTRAMTDIVAASSAASEDE